MTKPKWFNNWNVSNVEDMEFMFNGARSFNQPLNNWDVSKVTDMRYMFYNVTRTVNSTGHTGASEFCATSI